MHFEQTRNNFCTQNRYQIGKPIPHLNEDEHWIPNLGQIRAISSTLFVHSWHLFFQESNARCDI